MNELEHPEPALQSEEAEQARQADLLRVHPEQWETFNYLVALLEEVRRCTTLAAYRAVQQHLVELIDRVDAAVGQANDRLAAAKKQRIKLLRRRVAADSEALTRIETEINNALFDRELYLRLGRQYRTVGDALAWQLYGFQALPLYALGLNMAPGINTNPRNDGALAEMAKIEEVWVKQQAFALRHYYTNCLRVADLSIFYPSRPDQPEILEVKKKAGKHIRSSQRHQGHRATSLTQFQACIQANGRLLLHQALAQRTMRGQVHTTLDLLTQALEQAKATSIGFAANDYMSVTVVHLANPAKRPIAELRNEWQEKTQGTYPTTWTIPCLTILEGTSVQKMNRAGVLAHGTAPYTIYPLSSIDAASLLADFIQVHYRLNTAVIAQALQTAGFEVENLVDQHQLGSVQPTRLVAPPYFRVRGPGFTLTIGDIPIRQMLFEGLPLEEFVASIIAQSQARMAQVAMETLPASLPDRCLFDAFSTYTSMEQVWARSREYILPITMSEG